MTEGNDHLYLYTWPHQGLNEINSDAGWVRFLQSDFSPTRFFEQITGNPIQVDLIATHKIVEEEQIRRLVENWYFPLEKLNGPLVQRETWLTTAAGVKIAYAVSWWNENDYVDYLHDGRRTIWANLSDFHGLKREVTAVFSIESPIMEKNFKVPGPYPSRNYFFLHDDRYITFIQEIFHDTQELEDQGYDLG